jgi:LemA protein
MSMGSIVVLVLVVLVIGYAIVIYNRLVAFRNRVRNGFAQIDVQLQRRYDLIPNLVETAKRYMDHERETLTGVIEARNQAKAAEERAARQPENAEAMRHLAEAEGGLAAALGRLFALQEAYPDLKADGTMRDLMEELSSTENKVSFARQHFNDAVMYYNTYREQFPNTLVAGPTGFQPARQLELEDPEAARQPVRVSFGT